MVKQRTAGLYFKNLDAIRFIAALMVLMGHTIRPVYNNFDLGNGPLYYFLEAVCNGELGVSVFFVLSGFLITYLLLREHEVQGKINLRNFYFRRILRIWPLYFMVVAFSFGIYPLIKTVLDVNNPLASRFVFHLFFLSNFDVINIQKFFTGSDALSQNITWSVSIEEQFYLVWPLIFMLPRRVWLPVIVSVVIISLGFRLIYHRDKIVLYYHTFSVLADLAVGGATAFLARYVSGFRMFFKNSGALRLALFALFAFACVFVSPWLYRFPFGEASSRLLIVISFALFICSQAFTRTESRWQLHRWGFADRWGKYTYGIYLIHPVVITLSSAVIRFTHSSPVVQTTLVALITFPLTLVLSYLSYRYFESRFLALKTRFETVTESV